MRSVRKPFFSLFLLALFTLYQAGTWVFTHVHDVDGAKIAHSHPNSGQHDHTAAELILIDLLTGAEACLCVAGEDFIWLMPRYCELRVDRSIPIQVCQLSHAHLLRAPPCSFF